VSGSGAITRYGGVPRSTLTGLGVIAGKAAIVAGFQGLFSGFAVFSSTLTAVYPSADSSAVCVEYRNLAVLTNGTEYTNENIAVFRFADGLISEYHDYFDPRRFQVVIDAF
jgi:ketosteroid isomerase-like protein